MCIAVKYGIWKIPRPEPQAVNALVGAGYPPLTAMVLAGRGYRDPQQAKSTLSTECDMPEPYLMGDMEPAAGRIAQALLRKERMAVFGDYDVDGITSTCLLTDFLRKNGADCLAYIPGRLEEGYGLNPMAIRSLHDRGVKLIITVDCGITAVEEAALCRELGMDLVITDHHECKKVLPEAVAIVDPHRPGDPYPHQNLSGVGVAFKLASALAGSQEEILAEYADMVCLGTVADVMPLVGENRRFVARGLEALQNTKRPGLAALIRECGCDKQPITATTIGYVLAPRINAAGRMGEIDLAVELFLTEDPEKGRELAARLCALNRKRQEVESRIYDEALSMLPPGKPPAAIVLAGEHWHQGVVGVVASRMAEEFCCPAFLICMDGDKGKASSRSYGGFNLFAALTELAPLLESYGGHELAAGFTISRENIDEFRRRVCSLAEQYYEESPGTCLAADCAVPAELLTLKNVMALDLLEPCGCGCPRPLLVLEKAQIVHMAPVGGGRHLRLRLRQGKCQLNAIYFSATAESASIAEGDLIDVACTAQRNEFRGVESVQLTVQDVRPSCPSEDLCPPDPTPYRRLRRGCLTAEEAVALIPQRQQLGDLWRYLAQQAGPVRESPVCLCRKAVRRWGRALSLSQMMVCLDIFAEAGLLRLERQQNTLNITLLEAGEKKDLSQTDTMQALCRLKGDD